MFLDENASVREQKVEPMMVTSGVLGVLGVALGHSGPIPDTRLCHLEHHQPKPSLSVFKSDRSAQKPRSLLCRRELAGKPSKICLLKLILGLSAPKTACTIGQALLAAEHSDLCIFVKIKLVRSPCDWHI